MIDWDSCVLWLDNEYFSESFWWDRSKYNNDGVVHGAKWKEDAFYFNNNNAVVCKDKPCFNFSQGLTIEIIFKAYSLEIIDALVYKQSSGSTKDGFNVDLRSGDSSLYFFVPDGTYWNDINTPINTHKKYHVFCTYDKNYSKIYIGDELKASKPLTHTIIPTSHNLEIGGRYQENTFFFHGKIYLIRLFSKALSDEEIKILVRNAGV